MYVRDYEFREIAILNICTKTSFLFKTFRVSKYKSEIKHSFVWNTDYVGGKICSIC